MVCSPEQVESNRRNSLKSTGPTSPDGKAAVARNSLKHGLTGKGVVVLDEDLPVIEERFVQFNADVNPLGVISDFLLRHLVLDSIKMDRGARHEAAALNRRMTLARQAEEDLARLELQAQLDRLADEPEAACRELERSPRGLGWMISSWRKLKVALADPDPGLWELGQVERVENLLGRRLVDPDSSRVVALSCAYHGHVEKIADWPELPAAERSQAARAELAAIIDAELARLNAVLANFDHAALEKRKAEALALALFDASKEAQLARKYAAAAERSFFKTLKTIRELNAEAEAKAAAEAETATAEAEITSEDLALKFPPTLLPEGPPKRRPPAPADRPKAKGRRSNRDPRRPKS